MITIIFGSHRIYRYRTTSSELATEFVKFIEESFGVEVITHVKTDYEGPEVNQIVVA